MNMAKDKNKLSAAKNYGVKRSLCVGLLTAIMLPVGASAIETNNASGGQSPLVQASTQRKIIGSVVDSKTGEPIIGANVIVKGAPGRGAATNLEGRFELSVAQGEVLVISYQGYTSKEIKVGRSTLINVTLSEDERALGEVVITAFGTGQKKETLTGAIQTVRPNDLKIPTANLTASFAGRLAGVIAYQRSGAPGSNGSDFFIRGVSSMNGSNGALIVLDGVEISKGDLDALDPEVIESFSVLKDASTTAMYGTRGANGVLIINTKKGADLDKPIIGVRAEAFVNTPINVPKIANAETFMRMYNEAVTSQGTGAILYSEDKIQGTLKGLDPIRYPNVDWYKELFKSGTFNQKANFNVRGGTNKVTYFMNLNAVHETGMMRGRSKDYFSFDNNLDFMKYTFQNNLDYNISPTAKVSLNLNVQLNTFHGPITGSKSGDVNNLFSAVMDTNPVDFPIMYPQGDDAWYHWGSASIGSTNINNPMAVATLGYVDWFENTVVANLGYEQNLNFITKGLKFRGLFAFKNWNRTYNYRLQGMNHYVVDQFVDKGDGTYTYAQRSLAANPSKSLLGTATGSSGDRKWNLQGALEWNREFGSHSLSAMALAKADEYNINIYSDNDLIASLPKRSINMAFRLSYDYKKRYIIEANAGYAGSENFAAGHRWGFFPSISAGWNVSQEKFWTPLKKVVSNFKVRASYGLTGNDQIGGERYIYMAMVNLTNAPSYRTGYAGSYETYTGPTFSRLQNDAITWEVSRKFNLGFDVQLFNSLNITAEIFHDVRSNIFQRKQSIPNSFGTANTAIYGNFAKVQNRGLDLAIDYGKTFSKDFNMQFRGTFTYASNLVLEYDEAPGLRPALRAVGNKMYMNYGYIANGLYIDQADIAANPKSTINNIAVAPGDIKYLDQPGVDGTYDGQITADDRVPLGYPTVPEIVYGFGPTIGYKNFDFSFYFQGVANTSIMMSGFSPFGSQQRRNVLQWIADDYWSKDNQNINAHHPRLTQTENNHNTAASSFWLRSGAFLKLKNLELGYKISKGARVYANVTNVFTISPFKLWDPEMGGGRGMNYPLQRTFNVGLQLTFNK